MITINMCVCKLNISSIRTTWDLFIYRVQNSCHFTESTGGNKTEWHIINIVATWWILTRVQNTILSEGWSYRHSPRYRVDFSKVCTYVLNSVLAIVNVWIASVQIVFRFVKWNIISCLEHCSFVYYVCKQV